MPQDRRIEVVSPKLPDQTVSRAGRELVPDSRLLTRFKTGDRLVDQGREALQIGQGTWMDDRPCPLRIPGDRESLPR
jgi:hypothetical protein